MSDWQVGDLAVCVDARPPNPINVRVRLSLEVGRIYRVTAAFLSPCLRQPVLLVEGEDTHLHPNGPTGWRVERFRKIRPDEREACEPEFVTLLRRSKQKESAMDRILRAETVEAVIGRVISENATTRRAA